MSENYKYINLNTSDNTLQNVQWKKSFSLWNLSSSEKVFNKNYFFSFIFFFSKKSFMFAWCAILLFQHKSYISWSFLENMQNTISLILKESKSNKHFNYISNKQYLFKWLIQCILCKEKFECYRVYLGKWVK